MMMMIMFSALNAPSKTRDPQKCVMGRMHMLPRPQKWLIYLVYHAGKAEVEVIFQRWRFTLCLDFADITFSLN